MENLLKKFEDANPEKRDRVVKKISESVDTVGVFLCLNFCTYTTLLPILQKWPEEFRGMIERALIDQDMKSDLEEAKLINWCRTSQMLYPLNTTKDGNCLLHSISLSIWGIEDQSLVLRRLLYCALQTDQNEVFKKRYFQHMTDRNSEVYGNLLQFDSVDQLQEWNSIIDNVEPKHNPSFAQPLPFLEPFHIYVMANVLKRPIIVMADNRVRTMATVSIQDNDIVGIYLPLDVQAGKCSKYPIVLGFNFNHFTPLVTTKEDPKSPRKLAIPLQRYDLSMMPIRFLNSAEGRQIGNLMSSYLHLVDLVRHSEPLSAAKLGDNVLPEDFNLIPDYFRDCERKYRRFLDGDSLGVFDNEHMRRNVRQVPQRNPLENTRRANVSPATMSQFQNVQCITEGCRMYGSASTGNMCSECLNRYTVENTGPPVSFIMSQIEPTAPPPSQPLNSYINPTSMVEQKCQTPNCKFVCSFRTFPLCHECKEKKQKQESKLTVNVIRQASNQSEEMTKLSARLDTNVQNGLNFSPQTQTNIKPVQNFNSDLSERDLFGPGRGCHGEIEVSSGNDFGSQTCLVSNMRKEAEVISPGNYQRQATPPFGSPTKLSCSNSGCNRTSISSYKRLCSVCYISVGSPGSSQATNQTSTTHQVTNQNSPRHLSTNQKTTVSQSTIQPSGSKDQKPNIGLNATGVSKMSIGPKHICAKPGCEGIRQENKYGMCLTCFEGDSPEKLTEPTQVTPGVHAMRELDMNRQGSIEDNLEVSETPSSAMIETRQVLCTEDDSTECASPLCDTRVYPPNKLCQNCLDVLRQFHPSPKKQPKKGKQATCKNTGCEFHGSPKFDGFCSQCYKSLLAGNSYVVQNKNSAPISRQNRYPVETPQPRSNSAPIARKGVQCQVEGCSYFGDPKFDNMCTNCYNIANKRAVEVAGSSKYPVQEASLSQGSTNMVSNFNSFERSTQILEQSRKDQTLCRRHECKNHGNSVCEGFCNNCFHQYYLPACRNKYDK